MEVVGSYCYIGETSRPFRERVIEHENNRKNWNKKSFQIAHWMERHHLDLVCPKFKYEIIGQYGDPLRRQLGEALNILETGNLNRKMGFNENEICRLESRKRSWELEQSAKQDMVDKKVFNENIMCFIDVMSNIQKSCATLELTGVNTCRFQKRKREMDSSTPVFNKRRERQLIVDEDESPIKRDPGADRSLPSSDLSGNETRTSMNPTGVSDELTKTHLTPQQIESSSLEERGLYVTAYDLTKAAEGCGLARRSTSLPDILRGIENDQYLKRITTPKRSPRRALSLYDVSLSPWDLKTSVDKQDPQGAACNFQPLKDLQGAEIILHADPQGAACNFQPLKDLQGSACDFQPDVKVSVQKDLQDTACDFQQSEGSSSVQDPQGAAFNFQRKSGKGRNEGLMNMMHIRAIPKQKQQRQIHNGDEGLGFGSNLDEDILNLTPIGLNSPKRRLLWSPETPDGRSRKYSIGETASPNLKKRISGVIAINGRYAIPSLDNGIELTALGD